MKTTKSKIYQYFTEQEQLKRTAKACGKLAYACGEFKATKSKVSLKYLAKRIAEAEFLLAQIKDTHDLEEEVYRIIYNLTTKYSKQARELAQLEAVLEGVEYANQTNT
jgi:hypothetical protein